MNFTKMHGCGNDYIYINGFSEEIKNPNELAVDMSDRHFGIGGDGLVLILPSKIADFRMRMFNSDGSESEMCGMPFDALVNTFTIKIYRIKKF